MSAAARSPSSSLTQEGGLGLSGPSSLESSSADISALVASTGNFASTKDELMSGSEFEYYVGTSSSSKCSKAVGKGGTGDYLVRKSGKAFQTKTKVALLNSFTIPERARGH